MRDADEAQFAELYTSAWPRLFRTTYAVCGDRQLAEDAVQSAFARAWAQWTRVSAADDPVAYLRRMAVNEALGRLRRASVRRERPVAVLPEAGRPATGPPDAVLADRAAALADRDATWEAVLALPARQRAVVALRYYEDLSEQEIAAVLGCRPGTVKSQASAALATLRSRLGSRLGDPEGSSR